MVNARSLLVSFEASEVTIQALHDEHIDDVAALHHSGIPGGLLSELGPSFLRELYRAIDASDDGFVLVAVDASGDVVGFVSGVVTLRSAYLTVLKRSPHLVFRIASAILSWRRVKRIYDVLRYPAKFPADLPAAELLSIVVASAARGKGVADALVSALIAEFERRGVDDVRVMVGARLERAVRLYERLGFTLATRIMTHGEPSLVMVRRGAAASIDDRSLS